MFFNIDQTRKELQASTFIHVGGEQFHALAVALIDRIKENQVACDDVYKKILDALRRYPKLLVNHSSLSPTEHINMLLTRQRMTDVVEAMADTLRQIALDEIFENPILYLEFFDEFTKDTEKAYLRKTDTPLPVSAFEAVSNALGITITLSYCEPEKEVRKLEIYENDASLHHGLNPVVQVQGLPYFPEVKEKNKGLYRYVGVLTHSLIKPEPNDEN